MTRYKDSEVVWVDADGIDYTYVYWNYPKLKRVYMELMSVPGMQFVHDIRHKYPDWFLDTMGILPPSKRKAFISGDWDLYEYDNAIST